METCGFGIVDRYVATDKRAGENRAMKYIILRTDRPRFTLVLYDSFSNLLRTALYTRETNDLLL